MPSRRPGCLKLLLWFAVIDCVLVLLVGEMYYNLGSNLTLYAFKDSKAPLEVKTKHGWRSVTHATVSEMGEALVEHHLEQGLRWCSLPVRRKPATLLQYLVSIVCDAEMNIITIAPDRFEFVTSYQPGFAPTTARERLATDKLTFTLIANFRDPNGRPLGWVYHNGREVNHPFPKWTGVFFVKNGMPYFGPKSLLDDVPGPVEEGTQGYPSVMKNHIVFSYVDLAPDKFFDGRKITYRSLAGMRRDGTIVLVLSGDGGALNVTEVTEIAKKLDVHNATLLDGGRALQYALRTASGVWDFHAFNTTLNLGPAFMHPQRSPVYIGVRPRQP